MLENLFGISEGTAINILTVYSSYFTKVDFFINCFRTLGWWIIKGLAFLVGKLEDIVNEVTFITDFFESAGINALITKFKPVLGLFLVFSIIFIGYQLMFNKKYDRSKLPMNIILALCIVVALPIAMTKLNDLTGLVIGEVKGNVSITKQIVSNNVTDLYLLDEADFPIDEKNQIEDIEIKNNMGSNILNIKVNEEIDRSKVKSKNKILFENEVIHNKNGVPELNKINGLFKWDDEYYRFSINFLTIICTLFITAFVLIFTAVKIVKLSIELAFSKIMTTFIAVADLSGGQKLRQSINGIISIFVSILATTLMLKLYILATAFFTNRLNAIATILAMVGAAIFVIDGPNYIEKIFGVDAGLSSAWRAVTGLNSALDIMNKMGKATSGALEKMKDLGVGALGGLSFAKGMTDGVTNKSLEDEMDKESSNNENDTSESLENQMENEDNNTNEDNNENKNDNINGDSQVNEDVDNKDGDNSIDNNTDNLNREEDTSDNITSLDEDIENEEANYNDEDLNNTGQQSLEDNINEENSNNINGNNDLTDINEESAVGSDELNISSDGEFNEASSITSDDMNKSSEFGIDDGTSKDELLNGEDNITSGVPNDESSSGNTKIEDEAINNKISDESGNENINSENEDIGYKNPIEDRNIYQIKRDNFKSKFDDLGIQLGRSYTIGKNTGRDIRKFMNKDKKGDKE